MAGDSVQDASEHDVVMLQGEWEQVGFEENGIVDSPDEHGGNGAITTIDGYRFSVRALDGECLLEGTFTLDASATPKAITWVDAIGADAGRRLPASYALIGDSFVFIAADEGASRPTVFRTGSGQVMRTFVRKRSSA